MTRWGAPGANRGARVLDAGDAKHQGAESSALKNNAPFSLTPLRMSENASIPLSGRPANSPGWTAKQSAQANARAIRRDAQAWSFCPVSKTIIDDTRRDLETAKPITRRR